MEYILNVRRIVPLTEKESEERERKQRFNQPYPSGVGMDYNVRTVEVLNVVLTEEEYNRAKQSIINSKS